MDVGLSITHVVNRFLLEPFGMCLRAGIGDNLNEPQTR